MKFGLGSEYSSKKRSKKGSKKDSTKEKEDDGKNYLVAIRFKSTTVNEEIVYQVMLPKKDARYWERLSVWPDDELGFDDPEHGLGIPPEVDVRFYVTEEEYKTFSGLLGGNHKEYFLEKVKEFIEDGFEGGKLNPFL